MIVNRLHYYLKRSLFECRRVIKAYNEYRAPSREQPLKCSASGGGGGGGNHIVWKENVSTHRKKKCWKKNYFFFFFYYSGKVNKK